MLAFAGLLYGALSYALFLATFLYAVAFVADLPVPKTIDDGPIGPVASAIAIDLALLGLFALQHSVMARPAFKRWWTRFVPPAIERATYVLAASLALDLLFWQWRPLPGALWTIHDPAAVFALQALSWCGWALVLASSFLLSHLELFGLAQPIARLRRRMPPQPAFATPSLYRRVRHPIYLGFLLAFWATPAMTASHLLFAVATTLYILIGIQLEERDLIALFGDQYRSYRRLVPMLLPFPRKRLAPLQAEPPEPAE